MSLFIAHRGLSAYAPENTHAAFDLAWAQDCAGIELDVQVSCDGAVVVHHDSNTARMTGVEKIIAETPWSELAALKMHNPHNGHITEETMPLLSDVLNAMPTGKIIQVEIKPEVVQIEAIIAVLRAARKDIQLWAISFNEQLLRTLGAALLELPSLWVVDCPDVLTLTRYLDYAQRAGFLGLDLDHRAINQATAEAVHAAGLTLACWTVDDPARARELAAMGVEMIASNVADQL